MFQNLLGLIVAVIAVTVFAMLATLPAWIVGFLVGAGRNPLPRPLRWGLLRVPAWFVSALGALALLALALGNRGRDPELAIPVAVLGVLAALCCYALAFLTGWSQRTWIAARRGPVSGPAGSPASPGPSVDREEPVVVLGEGVRE